MKKMIKKIKDFWIRVQLSWLLLKADNHLLLTNSFFDTSVKNVDLTNSDYVCIENEDGSFSICYMIPWNMGQKCFTFTVAKFKGANAGQMCDATVELLNNHTLSGTMITGDSKNQPYPTHYVNYIKKDEKN